MNKDEYIAQHSQHLYDPEPWLHLGIAGGALFIVLMVVICMFAWQTTHVTKLVHRIDLLASEFAKNNQELTRFFTTVHKDQQVIADRLDRIDKDIRDISKRATRIDARIYDNLYQDKVDDVDGIGSW